MSSILFSIPTILAQVSDSTDGMTEISTQGNPVAGIIGGIIGLGIALLMIISMWKIFTKAGQPGWAAIIPIYNTYVLCKVAGKPGWWLLLLMIPFVNFIIFILVALGLAERFGRSTGFGLGIVFFSVIFLPILAFGDSRHQDSGAALSPLAA